MSPETKSIWNQHYLHKKANLLIPDENVVRYFSKLTKKPGRQILDLGCGSGRNGIWLLNQGHDVYFQDYSPNSIELLKRNLANCGLQDLPSEKIKTGPAHQPVTSRAGFDFILAWGVLHYNSLEQIKEILENIRLCLKPRGIFFGSVRAVTETFLDVQDQKSLKSDIAGSTVVLFDEKMLKDYFKEFDRIRLGYTERAVLGDLHSRICHWLIEATMERTQE